MSVLRNLRDATHHEVTPVLAADVDPDNPQGFQLVILGGTPREGDWFPQPVLLSQLFEGLEEVRSNLRAVERWVVQEVEAFERNETDLAPVRPRRKRGE